MAHRWVLANKPTFEKFADTTGLELELLRRWQDTSFWKNAVVQAEYDQERAKKRKKGMRSGAKLPKHLLEQAVFLWLAGKTYPEIGSAVGRSPVTVFEWRKTVAWDEMKEQVMQNKLRMHLLDQGMTIREVIAKQSERYLR